MSDLSKIAKVLGVFKEALEHHDKANPSHTAYGIGMAAFDIDRLGLEDGETILPGIQIHCDGGTTGNFRVLCDGQHDEDEDKEEAADEVEVLEVVAVGSRPDDLKSVPPPDEW